MSDELLNLKVVLLRDELEIHYCDKMTLETVKVIRFKSLEDFEKYIQSIR